MSREQQVRGDPELILFALPEAEQAMVERWEKVLGFPRGGWFQVAAFRNLVTLVATLDGAADGAAAFIAAAEGLGYADDESRRTHPADDLARTLRNWLRAAWKKRKKFPAAIRPKSRHSG